MKGKPGDLIERLGAPKLIASGVSLLLVVFLMTRPGLPRFLVIGILQGAIISLVALGIVLVYKGSRVFNFAQAEFGTSAAFVVFIVFETLGLPYGLAVVVGLVAAGALGYLLELLVVRPLTNAPRVTLLVATAGAALLAIGVQLVQGGREQRTFDPLIAGNAFKIFGEIVSYQELVMVAVLAALAIGLAYFFNKTDLGLAVLATSQESVATELVGIGTRRISSLVWTMAAVLGGVAGILQIGNDGILKPGAMTSSFLLAGFTAAVIGGITSLSGAFLGGQVVGLLFQLGTYFDDRVLGEVLGIDINAFPELVIFLALLAILIFKPSGLLGAEA